MALTSPRASARSAFRRPALQWATEGDWRGLIEWVRDTTTILQGVLQGKLNATGTVTLDANSATTTISDIRIGADTVVILMPTSANAAADFGAGTFYLTYPNAANDAAVINHADNANTDKTFTYTLIG
tara:strand:- start:618 stop:1001 length:384 start_codon:yes stop_codon:yes gene_type:complete